MAGLVPAIHVLLAAHPHEEKRGCPAQGRAWRSLFWKSERL